MTKRIPLTPTSELLIIAFDNAACDWGHTRHVGEGEEILKTEAQYIEADERLRRRVSSLERTVRRLKHELREHFPNKAL